MELALPPLANWQDFQLLCHAVWAYEWECPAIQLNGRSGQKQRGVDIFGMPRGSDRYHGIQCKLKSTDAALPPELTTKEIDEEVRQALSFEPPLEGLIIATTAPSDESIQKYARELSQAHRARGLFTVDVLAWPEIRTRMFKHDSVLDRFFPGLSPRWTELAERKGKSEAEVAAISAAIIAYLSNSPVGPVGQANLPAGPQQRGSSVSQKNPTVLKEVPKGLFDLLDDRQFFVEFLTKHFATIPFEQDVLFEVRNILSLDRLVFAHQEYLASVDYFASRLVTGDPGHQKRAGALLHALLISHPIVEVKFSEELLKKFEDNSGARRFSEFYRTYANELSSFDCAYRCCSAYEVSPRACDFQFLQDLCVYLARNKVDAETAFMIFRALMQ